MGANDSKELLVTAYRVRSALEVASLIDRQGSRAIDARQSYHYLTRAGEYPPDQLREGEAFLRQVRLIVERDGVLYPTEGLSVLARITKEAGAEALLLLANELFSMGRGGLEKVADNLIADPLRRESLLLSLQRRFDAEENRKLGEAGEEAVASTAREELIGLGREDLAEQVSRVSLISDQLGYDVTAPRIDGTVRLLEVKTCGSLPDAAIGFFLSRNEAETGLRFRDWALVICIRRDSSQVRIVGWCAGQSLRPYLPSDGAQSEWIQARLTIPMALLRPGLPGPI